MSRPYNRAYDLPRILPIEASLMSAPAADVAKLIRRALEAEKLRGITGHWSYNLPRHAALIRAYAAEAGAAFDALPVVATSTVVEYAS